MKIELENITRSIDRELKYLSPLQAAELLRQVQAFCERRLEHPASQKPEKTRPGSGNRTRR